MILVTGASGKTGRAIVAQLAKNRHRVRGWVRRPDLLIEGVTDLFVGDMENRSNWEQAQVHSGLGFLHPARAVLSFGPAWPVPWGQPSVRFSTISSACSKNEPHKVNGHQQRTPPNCGGLFRLDAPKNTLASSEYIPIFS